VARNLTKLSTTRIVLAVTALAVVYFLVSGSLNAIRSHQLRQQESSLQGEIRDLQERFARLEAVQDYLDSDEYIETVARQQLGLVREGEVGLVVISTAPTPTPEPGAQPEGELYVTFPSRAFGAGSERLGEIAGIFDAAVGDHRDALFLRRLDRIHDGGELRHADAGNDARGADRARADANLDGIGAAVDQRPGAFAGGDVAGHHLHRVRQPLDAQHRVEHIFGMAVRGVDHDQIDAGRDQRLGARETLVADRGRGGDAQAALFVLAGVWIGHRLFHVLDGDQTDAAILIIHHQQLLDAVLMQQALGFVLADALAHGDELVLGHQLGHALSWIGGKAHVAVGQDADDLAGFVAVVAIIIAGVRYMGAGGNPEKAASARKGLYNGLLGLVIALTATAIVAFIGNSLAP